MTKVGIGKEGSDLNPSIKERGSNIVTQVVEIVDSNGDQITNFGGEQSTNSSVGSGNAIVATAGTAVQLSSTSIICKRVIVHAVSGHCVVGGSNVKYDPAHRKGVEIFKTQREVFYIDNVNKLYIDAKDNNTLVSYYYEN